MDNFSNTKIANVRNTAWITSIIQSYKTSVIQICTSMIIQTRNVQKYKDIKFQLLKLRHLQYYRENAMKHYSKLQRNCTLNTNVTNKWMIHLLYCLIICITVK